jgi:hypothetical protein
VINGYVSSTGGSAVPYVDYAAQGEHIQLTPALQAQVERLAREAKLLDDVKATFQIKALFKREATHSVPYLGLVTAWANAAHDGYTGAQLVYFCTQEVERADGTMRVCSTPIPPMLLGGPVAVCPKCKRPSRPEALCGQVMARLPTDKWALLLTRMFFTLNCDADLQITHESGSLRVADAQEREKVLHGDALNAVRASRSVVVYSLGRIVKDTGSGSAVLTRFKALLSA